MFRFSPPVEYNECVAPICLPEQGYVFEPMTDTYAIGWGNLHCKVLEHFCSFIKKYRTTGRTLLIRTRLIRSST